ncbi:MAG: SprT-like domain-containing protein [Desulfobacterales bacterium]|nr:SprT-like domain-containing protein [Desulfobacterales bacterium]
MMECMLENIEFKWAAQLVKEHRDISWRYGVKLATPTINISSGKKTLGLWCDKNKTLSISSYLIKNEFWDIVLEVLKHEMAHQYVSEFNDNADRHGKYFKIACKILGVHPAFIAGSANDKTVQEFKGELPAEARKMLKKVEKLMALGQSGNEAEAQSASRKANYLLNKYNLQRINTGDDNPDIKYLTICHKKKRIESIQRAILSVLRNYYYVNCLTSNTYHAQDDAVYKSIVLVGRRESLKVAEYVYRFLLDTGQTLWQDFKKKNNAKRGQKNSFDMGFIAGIDHNHKKMFEDSGSKINKNSSLPMKTIKSLMEKNQIDNQIEISRLFPKLRTIKFGRHQTSSGAFKEGFKNGKNTHINKGMTHCQKGTTGLLVS